MRINIKKTTIILVFVLMLFVTCLDAYFTNYFLKFFVKHMDELLVACLLVYVAININYILSHKRKLFFVFSLFLLVGFFLHLFFITNR